MNLRIDIAYDGRNFFGSQRQLRERTVQGELERVLAILFQQPIGLQLSSRTDAGVHARRQVGHFHTTRDIPKDRVSYALTSLLPQDIQLLNLMEVSEHFHARFDATEKTYEYHLTYRDDVFERAYKVFLSQPLDLMLIDQAISQLVGEHDFFSFSNRRKAEQSTVRNLRAINYRLDGNDLIFSFRGEGFLYKMVRILMQYLIHVGTGKIDPARTRDILESHSREHTRKVAPPQGLYLTDIRYDSSVTSSEIEGNFMRFKAESR